MALRDDEVRYSYLTLSYVGPNVLSFAQVYDLPSTSDNKPTPNQRVNLTRLDMEVSQALDFDPHHICLPFSVARHALVPQFQELSNSRLAKRLGCWLPIRVDRANGTVWLTAASR